MSQGPVRHCPGCGQALRFPADVGGMLMACPECGRRFASPFRLAGTAPTPVTRAVPTPLTPPTVRSDPLPSPEPDRKPAAPATQAARVAALYASKS